MSAEPHWPAECDGLRGSNDRAGIDAVMPREVGDGAGPADTLIG